MARITAFILNLLLVCVATGAVVIFLSPRLIDSPAWRATITPLASIIGSGFLVSLPLIAGEIGNYAVFGMAGLIVYAFFVGGAIRFNIRHGEPVFAERSHQGRAAALAFGIEKLSHLALVFAYFISVAYYLSLLSIFLLKGLGVDHELAARGLTSGFLAFIGIYGFLRGLGGLERLEEYAVGFKLAIIAAVLVGLVWHNSGMALAGVWGLRDLPAQFDTHTMRVLLGLIIVVQGFETSRFLSQTYPAELRVRTMRNAQLISAAIYILFFALATVVLKTRFADGEAAAIIDIVGGVAMVLPAMLVGAAVASQFSASIADAIGGAGLMHEMIRGTLPLKTFYPVIAIIAAILVWTGSVFDIIALASRAFASYYFLQCVVAASVTIAAPGVTQRKLRLAWFVLLALISLSAAVLGLPSEG